MKKIEVIVEKMNKLDWEVYNFRNKVNRNEEKVKRNEEKVNRNEIGNRNSVNLVNIIRKKIEQLNKYGVKGNHYRSTVIGIKQ